MPAVPIHFEPPWWRPCCSASRSAQRLHQLLEAADRRDLGLLLRRSGASRRACAASRRGRSSAGDDRASTGQRLEPVEDVRRRRGRSGRCGARPSPARRGRGSRTPRRRRGRGRRRAPRGSSRYSRSETGTRAARSSAKKRAYIRSTPRRPRRTTRTSATRAKSDGVDGGVLQLVEPVAAAPCRALPADERAEDEGCAISMGDGSAEARATRRSGTDVRMQGAPLS